MKWRSFLLGVFWLGTALANLEPVGDPQLLGSADGQAAPRWIQTEDGLRWVVWEIRSDSAGLRYRVDVLGADGILRDSFQPAPLSSPETDILDVSAQGNQIAVLRGTIGVGLFGPLECQIDIFTTDGSLVSSGSPVSACTRGHAPQIAWIKDGRIAFAINSLALGAGPTRIIVGRFGLFDPGSGQSTPVDTADQVDGDLVFHPAVSVSENLIAWSYTSFDESLDDFRTATQLYDAETGMFTTEPINFGGGSQLLHGALLGRHLVQVGTRCNDRSCFSPAILLRERDGSLVQPWTAPRELISAELSGSNPGLVYELSSVVVQGDQIRAFWTTRLPEPGSQNGTVAVVLDASGEFVGRNGELVLARDPRFRSQNQISDSFLTARVAQGTVQVYWSVRESDSQTHQLRAQTFQLVAEADAGTLSLSGLAECTESVGWVRPVVSGDATDLWIRTALQSTPANETRESLAAVGTVFELLDGENGQVLERRVLRASDLSCPNILEITKTSDPGPEGLFTARLDWNDLPDTTEVIDLRINDPMGPLFARSAREMGSALTGRWVRNGMVFFAIEANSGKVIAFRIARP
ncbi:MAG: hypothetical protein AAF358_04610 [Pseudomonadota bacterium]